MNEISFVMRETIRLNCMCMEGGGMYVFVGEDISVKHFRLHAL